jgi:hypothetical protein
MIGLTAAAGSAVVLVLVAAWLGGKFAVAG